MLGAFQFGSCWDVNWGNHMKKKTRAAHSTAQGRSGLDTMPHDEIWCLETVWGNLRAAMIFPRYTMYSYSSMYLALEAMARLAGWFMIIWKLYFLLLKILVFVTQNPGTGFCTWSGLLHQRAWARNTGFRHEKMRFRHDFIRLSRLSQWLFLCISASDVLIKWPVIMVMIVNQWTSMIALIQNDHASYNCY